MGYTWLMVDVGYGSPSWLIMEFIHNGWLIVDKVMNGYIMGLAVVEDGGLVATTVND